MLWCTFNLSIAQLGRGLWVFFLASLVHQLNVLRTIRTEKTIQNWLWETLGSNIARLMCVCTVRLYEIVHSTYTPLSEKGGFIRWNPVMCLGTTTQQKETENFLKICFFVYYVIFLTGVGRTYGPILALLLSNVGSRKNCNCFFRCYTHTYVSEDGHGRIYIKQNFSSIKFISVVYFFCMHFQNHLRKLPQYII